MDGPNRLPEIMDLHDRLVKLNAKFPDNRSYASALVSLRQAAHQYKSGSIIVAHRALKCALEELTAAR
jgi:hypothetical protein